MTELREVERLASGCTRCSLSRTRTQVVFGTGSPSADLMLIGEGPGFHEDRRGEPFVGPAGALLDRLLGEIGVRRADVYIANVVKCRPPGNRDPLPVEIESCGSYLAEQLRLVDPAIVVTLGNFATRYVLDRQVSIGRVRGQVFRVGGRTVLPTFHPAAVLHGGGERSPAMQALRADFVLIGSIMQELPPRPARQTQVAEQVSLF